MSCSCCHHEDDDKDEKTACATCADANEETLEGEGDGGEEDDDDEDDDDEDPSVLKRRIIVAAVLLVAAVIIQRVTNLPLWAQLLIYLPSYVVAGESVVAEAAESVAHGHPFDEDFLMSIATIGALLIGFVPGGEPQFAEAVFVMLFFQVGELFEGIAEGNSKRSIKELLDIRPDAANVERNGEVVVVDPNTVQVGEVILVKPGEKIPLDGTVIEGTSSLDTRAITGESVPRSVKPGEDAFSGCVNLSGVLRLRVTKAFGESTASKIIDMVKNAGSSKSHSEKFIKRFAKVYTPIVVYLAIAVAILPPLVSGDFGANFAKWLLRALTFLVVSCPCALVLSVPLAFFGGIGSASKHGILVKGSNYLEALANAQVVVFDKTGTLTKGVFKVTTVHPSRLSEDQLLHLAAHVEHNSTHPIAAALRDAYPSDNDGCTVSDVTEEAGHGVLATVNGHRVAVGNDRLMDEVGATWQGCHTAGGTVVHVAVDGEYAGHIHISDEVKDDSREAIANIKAEGVRRCVMLTGDREATAASVTRDLGLDEYHAELLPADKVDWVERLLGERERNATLAFVGDGINDAPVLARADVGIAMGAMGSDAAIEAADVVLMDDKPSKIAVAIRIARRTIRIARQNIVFAIVVKVAILCLAVVGLAPMWLAVFGDVGVMVLCVLNAMRVLR